MGAFVLFVTLKRRNAFRFSVIYKCSVNCLSGNFTKNLLYANEHFFGGLAQLVEHLPCKQGVSGSIPLTSTKAVRLLSGLIAQLVRAHA